jgi:hypothetical protein
VLHAGVLQAAAVLHQLRELSNEAMDNALQVGWRHYYWLLRRRRL